MLLNARKMGNMMEQQDMGVAHFAFLQTLKKGTEELQEFIVKKIAGSLQ